MSSIAHRVMKNGRRSHRAPSAKSQPSPTLRLKRRPSTPDSGPPPKLPKLRLLVRPLPPPPSPAQPSLKLSVKKSGSSPAKSPPLTKTRLRLTVRPRPPIMLRLRRHPPLEAAAAFLARVDMLPDEKTEADYDHGPRFVFQNGALVPYDEHAEILERRLQRAIEEQRWSEASGSPCGRLVRDMVETILHYHQANREEIVKDGGIEAWTEYRDELVGQLETIDRDVAGIFFWDDGLGDDWEDEMSHWGDPMDEGDAEITESDMETDEE